MKLLTMWHEEGLHEPPLEPVKLSLIIKAHHLSTLSLAHLVGEGPWVVEAVV